MRLSALLVLALSVSLLATTARAKDIFDPSWASIASDRRASSIGDILTVVVYQSAEARNTAERATRKRNGLNGSILAGSIDERASLSLEGDYSGRGEARRSETFVTQMSVTISDVLPNGDFLVAGQQLMQINGENTTVRVRGRVRPADITSDNQILSTRIADAEISYDGKGFVSRSAKPGILNAIFAILGLIG